MQIQEVSRTHNPGYWCGTAWGHNIFYSETAAVTLTLRLFNLTAPEPHPHQPSLLTPQDTILLRLGYKFLRKETAIMRYGRPSRPSYRGEELPNTFCDKIFENCDERNCKIQSPNYPGLYPRNLTCHYYIRQTRVPGGKVALVSVLQRNPHLMYIKDRNAPHLTRERKLEVGPACHSLHDYLVVYDGNTTRAPQLAKVCKGGTVLSALTASGPDLLLLFHSSPYDFPFQDSPRRRTFGFELDVEVEFVEQRSTAYVRRGGVCDYHATSQGQRSGYIQAAAHSLLPNTTCTWQLVAGRSEVVWLYFLHFRHVKHQEMPPPARCPTTFTIVDGGPRYTNSSLILGKFCKAEKMPRVCGGVHAPGPYAAPCSTQESYISTLPGMTLTLRYAAGTAPAHVEFLARYEFVDTRQWGDPTPGGGPCDRTFTVRPDRLFASPRDVFLFGRGGSQKLRCVYTFRVGSEQRVALRILRSRMGQDCSTILRNSSRRYECHHNNSNAALYASIKVKERLWDSLEVTRACLCNVSDSAPFNLVSYTSTLTLIFNVPTMTPVEDYNHYFFEGEYSVVAAEGLECGPGKLQGTFGNFTVGSGRGDFCDPLPRLITAPDASFLFMRVRGFEAREDNCQVASRINVFAAGSSTPLASVCPQRRDVFTNIFSSGWHHYDFTFQDRSLEDELAWLNTSLNLPTANTTFTSTTTTTISTTTTTTTTTTRSDEETWRDEFGASRDLVVEWVGNYSGRFLVTWVALWRPLRPASLTATKDPCPHSCGDIGACLPQELWCDGISHCPTGADEGAGACGLLAALPWVYLVAAGALLLSLVGLFLAVVIHRRHLATQQAVVAAATAAVNNGTGWKSGRQDLLLPPDPGPDPEPDAW